MDTPDHGATPAPAIPDATPGPRPETGPPAARRRGRGLAAGAVGAVVGGVLAAAVAVPVTVQAVEQDDAQAVAGAPATPAPAPDPAPAPAPEGALPPGLAPGSTSGGGTEADEALSRGVLLVETTTTGGSGAGTALVLSATGLALTNYHVVEGATEVTTTVAATGEQYAAEVVGFDEGADVALLRLDGAEGLDTVDPDDDGATLEEEVTAVGNARGEGRLLAAGGRVLALEQEITTSDGMGVTARTEDLDGLIETDASVVGGYSGGPLYDDEGEVVGITTAASSTATQSWAVPIDDALAIAGAITAGDESGSVQVGPSAWLGISVDVTAPGVAMSGVEDGGPSAAAGLTAGDTLTSVDGTAVAGMDELSAVLDGLEPGETVAVTWQAADGRTGSAEVTLGTSPVA
jgi:S1-C subfamily serine protease